MSATDDNHHASILTCLRELFATARSKAGIEYIYTLVRVEGLTLGIQDPFLKLRFSLQDTGLALSDEELLLRYYLLAGMEEPLFLVANLLNCAQGQPYNLSPFLHLHSGQFPNIVKPGPSQMARELTTRATLAGKSEIAQIIGEAYPDGVLANYPSSSPLPTADHIKTAFQKCHSFLEILLEIYLEERLTYRELPRFHKLPGFEVLELLVDNEQGLYGFRMHFSNGSFAVFARRPDSTECTNVIPEVPINFMVGDLDALRQEWRVGEKRLYEVGLPGRYNKPGEWKPIIYPGDTKKLQQDACALSDDPDVQGVLFYMRCTGHRGIEFVIRTTIELPVEHVRFGEKLYLWKCPPLEDVPNGDENVRVYDGWQELTTTAPEDIRSTLNPRIRELKLRFDQ